MDDDDNFLRDGLTGREWSDEARKAFAEAREALVVAVDRHANYYLASNANSSFVVASTLNAELLSAAIDYANAQCELSGNVLPFGDLEPWDEPSEGA